MSQHQATFFLSTGRCATQWLASALSAVPTASVVHECWQDHALTRRLRDCRDPGSVEGGERLIQHAEQIEMALETGPYFETGFPIWTSLPWLIERLGAERVRIVHLPRHPVPTALSWLTHGAWQPPALPHLPPGRVLIEADDPGTLHREYQPVWSQLGPYDKALFFWAELHASGLQLQAEGRVSWLRLRFEELFSDAGLAQLAGFTDTSGGLFKGDRVDAWSHLLMMPVDWRQVSAHPAVLSVAQALGYEPLDVDVAALQARFGPGVVDAV